MRATFVGGSWLALLAGLGMPLLMAQGRVALAADEPAVLVAAGDIASCSSTGDEATAALLDGIPGAVATLGDNVYDSGTSSEFATCYDPSWGRHKARTHPAPGNHDYQTAGAAGYFGYFGAAAGDPAKGYYSYDLGAWHVVALNSNCSQVGGCGAGSPQEQWLRADLAAHPAACTAAYWHHPRFSSGTTHGSAAALQPLWQALYDRGADLVLSGHEHNYERFAPQDPAGNPDPARGLREFVVGTGGKSHYGFSAPLANSEVRNADTFGVLKLTLRATGYDWEFVPEAGKSFRDAGSAACVGAPSADTTAPSVQITAPANGAVVPRRATMTITATASDDVAVARVEFYVNGALTCTASTAPSYSCAWNVPGKRGATYTLLARAYDPSGNAAESSVRVTSSQ